MSRWLWFSLVLLLMLGLPLVGVGLAGKPIGDYLEFPPRTRFVEQAPFSWTVFGGLTLAVVASIIPFLLRIIRCSSRRDRPTSGTPHCPFPWWGWLGAAWTLVAWILAWTRWSWMVSVQTWTFTPLWIGYIVVANAMTVKRGGTSLMLDQPERFAALFPVSALFWWLFEYLNRFVQNWYYGGTVELSAAAYLLQASIPFSTVLPAVVSTYCLLATMPRLWCGLERGPWVQVKHPRAWAFAVLILAGVGLTGLGLWPNELFPLVWVAPLILIVCVQVLTERRTIFDSLRHGDWRTIWTAAMASLVCGIFWELWNWGSLAHWTYVIPYVDRFHLFAMPLLGYAGYLPFGLECLVIADLVLRGGKHSPVVAHAFPW